MPPHPSARLARKTDASSSSGTRLGRNGLLREQAFVAGRWTGGGQALRQERGGTIRAGDGTWTARR
jgi:hypothetical protein